MKRVLFATLIIVASVTGCGDDTDGNDAGGDEPRDVVDTADAADGDAAADAPDVPEPDASAPDAAEDSDSEPQDVVDDADPDADADSGRDVEDEPDVVVVPDESVINAIRSHDTEPATDTTYLSEETAFYREGDGLPEGTGAVHALARVDGVVYAGTDAGLAWLDDDGFVLVEDGPGGPITVLAEGGVTYADELHVVLSDGVDVWLYSASTDTVVEIASPPVPVVALASDGTRAYAASSGAVYSLESDAVTADGRLTDVSVRDVAVLADESVAVATADGLVLLPRGDGAIETHFDGVALEAVSACPDGGALAGSSGGLHRLDALGAETTVAPGIDALPTGDVQDVYCGPTLDMAGHAVGATVYTRETGHRDHYASGRWMLDRDVSALVEGAGGARLFAAPTGIAAVELVPRTLGLKAATRHAVLERYFRRLDGFVSAEYVLPDPWTIDGGYRHDKDNDGLWTQMMIGAWSYAHAVTGDDEYCDAARRSIANMLLLVDIPCETFAAEGLECGFIARSFVRDDEGAVYEQKIEQPNWHPVVWTDDRTYRWKDDTSSDELDGHTYGFALYYDICATEEERAVIAETFSRVTDYIIDGEYLLIDLDGEKTTHGHWNPANISSCVDGLLNCREDLETCGSACFGGGFLNGMEILGQLLVTWHMTGDERYYLEYERLIREERYDEVITNVDNVWTLHDASIENHSDHELMMLAIHSLIRYEPNPGRLARWREVMAEMYETERVERHPLWAAFNAGLTGTVLDLDEAIESLRLYPWDMRTWPVDNTHRQDMAENVQRDRFGDRQFVGVLPWDETGYLWFNGNPHEMIQGRAPNQMQAPTHFLLAYWALRYYGLLVPGE